MKKKLLVIIYSGFLLSCSETSSYFNSDTNNKSKHATTTKRVKYTCDRNTTLSVNFTSTTGEESKNIAIINGFGDQAIILANQETKSGFLYSNGRYTLRGKETQASWTVGRMAPVKCSVGNKFIAQKETK